MNCQGVVVDAAMPYMYGTGIVMMRMIGVCVKEKILIEIHSHDC